MKPELITPAELTRWAEEWERCAARAEAGARDGERVANDPSSTDYTRSCARRAAEIARGHAAEYRAEALVMRDGEVPEPYWHLYVTADPDTPLTTDTIPNSPQHDGGHRT
ncbi:hypothetical protein OG352_39780 (plasmid) [Streptomyces sp. NBC_01485]|uniref:hypothetical protein n=1 Tax=Streptomyces sp. NBC_01485 TaxID=2903884 RepID=UPI002E30E21B|nr:hypothetical protein [Streptomyces sp. NBC_01485]